LQYHLATNASKTGAGGILFQLHDKLVGTKAQPQLHKKERIIMFIFFRLADIETQYRTIDREALAVVRCLAEVQWLVMGSPFLIKLYIDHQALESILSKGAEVSTQIVK
jgi:RNase H-like domain found in reverse transcriptase